MRDENVRKIEYNFLWKTIAHKINSIESEKEFNPYYFMKTWKNTYLWAHFDFYPLRMENSTTRVRIICLLDPVQKFSRSPSSSEIQLENLTASRKLFSVHMTNDMYFYMVQQMGTITEQRVKLNCIMTSIEYSFMNRQQSAGVWRKDWTSIEL